MTKELKYIFFQNNSGHPGLQTDMVSNAKNFINSKKIMTQNSKYKMHKRIFRPLLMLSLNPKTAYYFSGNAHLLETTLGANVSLYVNKLAHITSLSVEPI